MLDLLPDYKDEVDEDLINVVHKLKELIDVFFEDHTNDRNNRLKLLLIDINSNRYRVQTDVIE